MTLFDFPALYRAYVACRRGKRASHNAQRYEVRLLDHLVTTSEKLCARRWSPTRSLAFVSLRPKAREIHAADFSDRVVHHLLVPRLEAIYEPLFIHDCYSNRVGKGTHAAVVRLQEFMRRVSRNGKRRAWFLQLDIQNFFNRIDRRILLALLQARLAKEQGRGALEPEIHNQMAWLCATLLAQSAAAGAQRRGLAGSFASVPAHKQLANAPEGCGIAIGNLTSQFFANVYLNELDQWIKHDLKCQFYLRYVDDFVLLHESPEQLLRWRDAIEEFLAARLGLRLKARNEPVPISSGCDFLGYVVRPGYRLVRRRVVVHCMERLDEMEKALLTRQSGGFCLMVGRDNREKLRASLASYIGHLRHAASYRLLRLLFDRYSWLQRLFVIGPEHGPLAALPLWQPPHPGTLGDQWRWFKQHYPGFLLLIQIGAEFAVMAADAVQLPAPIRKLLKPGGRSHLREALCYAPLSRLRALRALLRRVGAAHLFVAEEGYLRHGLKRRVARLLWEPVGSRQLSVAS